MANLKDTIVLGNLTTTGAVTSNTVTANTVHAECFMDASSGAAIAPNGGNELNFASNTNFIYFGYTPAYSGSQAVNTFVFCNSTNTTNPVGTVKAANFYASSDIRLKENIVIPTTSCLDVINKISLKEFVWKHDINKKKNIGVIAQELIKVVPEQYIDEFINRQDESSWTVNDGKLVYLAIGAIQEQNRTIQALQRRIEELERGER